MIFARGWADHEAPPRARRVVAESRIEYRPGGSKQLSLAIREFNAEAIVKVSCGVLDAFQRHPIKEAKSMKYVCWVVPITPGKTEVARAYCASLESDRRAEYVRSEREIGIDRELFFIWTDPSGRDNIILYMDGENLDKALQLWTEHQGEFELWGKAQWADFSDPNDWPNPLWAGPGESGLPELVSVFDESRED